MTIGHIYCITNSINQKQYIGKTFLPISTRFRQHQYEIVRNSKRPLYRAMLKYGIENFTIELLESVEHSLLSEREKYWIDYKNTLHNGYNATYGGDGKILYDYDDIVSQYKSGALCIAIAENVGCSTDTVGKILRAGGCDTIANSKTQSSKPVLRIDSLGQEKYFDSRKDAARELIICGLTNNSIKNVSAHIGQVVNQTPGRYSYLGFKWEEPYLN